MKQGKRKILIKKYTYLVQRIQRLRYTDVDAMQGVWLFAEQTLGANESKRARESRYTLARVTSPSHVAVIVIRVWLNRLIDSRDFRVINFQKKLLTIRTAGSL